LHQATGFLRQPIWIAYPAYVAHEFLPSDTKR
jgi:hypothetical protein